MLPRLGCFEDLISVRLVCNTGMELGFIPDWSLPAHVQAFMTVRAGGVSRPPFDALNLGDHVGDDPLAVAENRRRLCARLGIQTAFLRQVHGEAVQHLTTSTVDSPNLVADIALSTAPRVAATIMVADCLPVLLAEPDGQWVAAAHAGWRGLAGEAGLGVMEVAVNAMRERMGQIQMQGRIVIGEGERDEAPMLYIGEEVGSGSGPGVDFAVDPCEGTNLCANSQREFTVQHHEIPKEDIDFSSAFIND